MVRKTSDNMLSRFHPIPERYRQTDRFAIINIARQCADGSIFMEAYWNPAVTKQANFNVFRRTVQRPIRPFILALEPRTIIPRATPPPSPNTNSKPTLTLILTIIRRFSARRYCPELLFYLLTLKLQCVTKVEYNGGGVT